MRHSIRAATLVIAIVFAAASTTCATPPADANSQADIVDRLDEILQRLDAIEQRLARVEKRTGHFAEEWIDDHGVIRSFDGRPIGHWGIDGLPLMPRR